LPENGNRRRFPLGRCPMNREEIQDLAVEVVSRLAPRLGADGRRGDLVVAFSGATAEFGEAVRQCRWLILDGYQVRLAFSPAAEQLFGPVVREQLEGFPHVLSVQPAQWLSDVWESQAVVCPMLSVNTLSKVSLLIADNLVSNLILHALFMGKTVVLARDGVDFTGEGRRALGIDRATPALRRAVDVRLQTVTGYGCRVTDAASLRATLNAALAGDDASGTGLPAARLDRSPAVGGRRLVVTAADVRGAHRGRDALSISAGSIVTPLARDLAMQLGVRLAHNGEEVQ
jgi:Flavoprotein